MNLFEPNLGQSQDSKISTVLESDSFAGFFFMLYIWNRGMGKKAYMEVGESKAGI